MDVVDARRLGEAVRRTGPTLLERVLTSEERTALSMTEIAGFSSVFGVKESTVKTVGGLPRGASFHDIVVGEDRGDGRARDVELRGRLEDWPDPDDPARVVGGQVDVAGLPVCWTVAFGSRERR